jgi:hypothetical protein
VHRFSYAMRGASLRPKVTTLIGATLLLGHKASITITLPRQRERAPVRPFLIVRGVLLLRFRRPTVSPHHFTVAI